jgi:hypothetical protein
MSFGIKITTDKPAALTSSLQQQGIACTVWNPSLGSMSGPVELELGFESQHDLMAAKNILGLSDQLQHA